MRVGSCSIMMVNPPLVDKNIEPECLVVGFPDLPVILPYFTIFYHLIDFDVWGIYTSQCVAIANFQMS